MWNPQCCLPRAFSFSDLIFWCPFYLQSLSIFITITYWLPFLCDGYWQFLPLHCAMAHGSSCSSEVSLIVCPLEEVTVSLVLTERHSHQASVLGKCQERSHCWGSPWQVQGLVPFIYLPLRGEAPTPTVSVKAHPPISLLLPIPGNWVDSIGCCLVWYNVKKKRD